MNMFKNIILLITACCFVGCSGQQENFNMPRKSSHYRITLFVQEVMEDGLLSYSRTYTTNRIKVLHRRYIEFDNITFSGDFLIEKAE